jgi:hypothetical protein
MIELGDNPTSIFQSIPAEAQITILWVREYFPELDGFIITFKGEKSDYRYDGLCDWARNIIHLSPRGMCCKQTIAHELTHLVQHHVKTVPNGERSCDLYTLARAPELNDSAPYYLSIPTDVRRTWDDATARWLCDAARMAIKLRSEGLRNYIVWFEEALKIGAFFRENCEVVTDQSILNTTAQKCNPSPLPAMPGLQSEGL